VRPFRWTSFVSNGNDSSGRPCREFVLERSKPLVLDEEDSSDGRRGFGSMFSLIFNLPRRAIFGSRDEEV
jgi:hypothetical protein